MLVETIGNLELPRINYLPLLVQDLGPLKNPPVLIELVGLFTRSTNFRTPLEGLNEVEIVYLKC